MSARLDLARFQADGTETCFHGRHIDPQKGLAGRLFSADSDG